MAKDPSRGVSYHLVYHPAVADEDLPRIPGNVTSRIARAIENRLTREPERYGVPLHKTLKGFWKLRVGDSRIVYRVVGTEIRILAIRHRRDVYQQAAARE